MKKRLSFYFLFILNFSAIGQHEAYTIIYANRNTLIKNITCCSTATANVGFQCYFPQRDSIIKMLQSLMSNGSIDFENKTIRIYLDFIEKFSYVNSSHIVISDKISMMFLIELLKSKDIGFADWSYEILMGQTSIVDLPKFKKEIKNALDDCILPDYKKNQLLTLTIPAASKDGIFFDTSKIRNEFKAHLGDTSAESKLIKEFETPSIYQAKVGQINALILCGTKKSLESLIRNFNKPIYLLTKSSYESPICTSATIREPIIVGLRRYFPDEPLLNDSFLRIRYDRYLLNNRQYIETYFRNIMQWAKKNFGITPKDKDLPPVISQGCGRP